jgi:hypothetical protein
MAPNTIAPQFEWVYQHGMLIGWPTICYFAWRVSKWVSETSAIAIRTVGQIDKMATNCFPTMQESLQTQDGLLHSMDESLKTMVTRMPARRKLKR